MTSKVVPFHAMDQALVDTLCSIIEALHEGRELSPAQKVLFDRIIGDELKGHDC